MEIKAAIIEFSAILAVFFLIDSIVDRKTKISISEHIFGFHNKTAKGVEISLISGLISFFIRDGKISKVRVFIYSLILGNLSLLIAVLGSLHYFNPEQDFLSLLSDLAGPALLDLNRMWSTSNFGTIAVLSILLIMPAISVVIDYFSIWFSRMLFMDRSYPVTVTTMLVLVDIIISTLPSFMLLVAVSSIGNSDHEVFSSDIMMVFSFMLFGASLQYGSAIFLGLIYFSSLAAATLIRSVISITRLNAYLVIHTNFHLYPFTFLGVFISIIIVYLL